MAKRKKGGRVPGVQNANDGTGKITTAWQNASTGLASVTSALPCDIRTVTLPDLDNYQVSELDKSESGRIVELESLLTEIGKVSMRVREMHRSEIRISPERKRHSLAEVRRTRDGLKSLMILSRY